MPKPSVGKLPADHYDEVYFLRQRAGAEVMGRIEAQKFRPYIGADHRYILDFGCGSGSLLQALPAERRVGVDINPAARDHARQLGLQVHADLSPVSDQSVDLAVSNHSLEHVEWPLGILREIYRILRPGGLAVVVVPCDRANFRFRADDPDFHLYSWSAGNLGNLARAAGFEVIDVHELRHRWPPKHLILYRLLGDQGFDLASRIWARLRRDRTQVRLVARRPE